MFLFGGTFAMITGDIGDRIDFGFGVAEQLAVPNQIVGMFVMGVVTDKVTAIVQDCGTPEELPDGLIPSVQLSVGLVE